MHVMNSSLSKSLIVDVRTPAEHREAHVPGSVNIPLGDLPGRAAELRQLAGERSILLACRTGHRALVAQASLRDGEDLSCEVLEGGIEAWETAGGALLRGKGGVSLERQVRIIAGSLVVVGAVLGIAVNQWFILLSAGVGGGLVFAGLTDTCAMGLLLAKLPYNRGPAQPTAPEG
jgi:rhodanese-related sulfurtransferase